MCNRMEQGRKSRRRLTGSALGALLVGVGAVGLAPPAWAAGAGLVPGTPCTVTARACVDLTTQKAWLISKGVVVLGPVPIHSGGPDEATPKGTFAVSWKDRNHVSNEAGHRPMPQSVFFASGGIAFHEGPLDHSSAGCVHLSPADAVSFYGALHRGDQVQVRAPGGDPASSSPARPEQVRAEQVRTGRVPAPGAKAGAGGGHTQPGIPGVTAIGPAPRT